MLAVYPSQHRLHDTRHLEWKGEPVRNDDVPQRADNILSAVQRWGACPVVPPQDYGLQPLRQVHADALLDYLQSASAQQARLLGSDGLLYPSVFAVRPPRHVPRLSPHASGYFCFDNDTPLLEGTWQAAYWSAQAALTAAEHTRRSGETAYAICRPPGHHASRDMYGGYCFLNNAAIAARYLQARTAILDIDYHHGNGTQEIFYADPEVLYVSLHVDPDEDYPYFWGGADETGAGAGTGCNLNLPLHRGAQDPAYLHALETGLAAVRAFQPAFLLVSVGFDCLAGDPQGGFCLTPEGLDQAARLIARLPYPKVLVQEGGYRIRELGDQAVRFLQAFSG